ncbi:glycosyltransferase, partial [bacterium]|nr:glycosyltransferase [bacterium]
GHQVLTIAPEFENTPELEQQVIRVPAKQRFNGIDFSVAYPFGGSLADAVCDFAPDLVHSHHPFLLGGTALRIARVEDIPLIFTHHTMYEHFTQYVPGDSPALKRFVIQLATSYANLCQIVIAPSESIEEILKKRGVTETITVNPTGIDLKHFYHGSGPGLRQILEIPNDSFLIGHVGRIAPEKNLAFLAHTAARFLKLHPHAFFLIVGDGPVLPEVMRILRNAGVGDRVRSTGVLSGSFLISAYLAMDAFLFTSKSETQGMVLAEALAAGTPVVALDAPGAREVVIDLVNGRLISKEDTLAFIKALEWVQADLENLPDKASVSAEAFSLETCTTRLLEIYQTAIDTYSSPEETPMDSWKRVMHYIQAEWDLIGNIIGATTAPFQDSPKD